VIQWFVIIEDQQPNCPMMDQMHFRPFVDGKKLVVDEVCRRSYRIRV
jgi:hypothetical protein